MAVNKTAALWCAFLSVVACAATPTIARSETTAPALTAPDDPALYTLGQLISRTLAGFALDDRELAIVIDGLGDGVRGNAPRVDLAAHAERLTQLQGERLASVAARERTAAERFRAAFATAAGTRQLDGGLLLQHVAPGAGASPAKGDEVTVHYVGSLIDGTVFDSSRSRGAPATLPLHGVIACWTTALQAMKVGGRSRIVCPPELAYGERGAPPTIKPGATLVFDIELLAIAR
jgi:FKBP-type peptidyl-prolyl cis-trans isomerase FkpA/FKBP-type peptidyl-prolyl cis-trans isomerase FklB